MTQQTAVDWLAEKLEKLYGNDNPWFDIPSSFLEQAKQMEKEQIKNAHVSGQLFKHNPYAIHRISDQAEIYYKEKYEGQEHQDQLNNPTPLH